MKKIIFTTHAKERMVLRSIKKGEIEKAVRKGIPKFQEDDKKTYEIKNIKIVAAESEEKIVILTVYQDFKSLDKRVELIPHPNEWWKKEGLKIFQKQAYFLSNKGVSDDEIIEHLKSVFDAVCGEFGE